MKASPEVRAAYLAALPDDPRSEARSMFGMPCAFVGGNMYFGTFDHVLVFRLGEADRVEARNIPGFGPFEPMAGRPWVEYVAAVVAEVEGATLAAWARRALEHTAALPAKDKKKKGKGSKTSPDPAA